MLTLTSLNRKIYDDLVKCPACGEPEVWHILIGKLQPVNTEDWHNITEGRLRPSDIFEEIGIAPMTPSDVFVPRQRDSDDQL